MVELDPREWDAKSWLLALVVGVVAVVGFQNFMAVWSCPGGGGTCTITGSCGETYGPTRAGAGGTSTTYIPYSYYPAAVYDVSGNVITAGWITWCGPGGSCPDGSTLLSDRYMLKWVCLPPPPPPPPPPPLPVSGGFSLIFTWIWAGIKLFFDKLPFLAIAGTADPAPGSTQTYIIQVTPPTPDTNCADGYCEYQYGMWGLVSKDQRIISEGTPTLLSGTGSYSQTITITIPSSPGSYVLTGVVTQINMTYINNAWTQSKETVIASEIFGLTSKAPLPTIPISPGFSGIFAAWIASFKAKICSVIGIFCG